MYTTIINWKDGQNRVELSISRNGKVVAEMSLDDWAALSATNYLIEEARRETVETLRQEAAGLAAEPCPE